MVQSKGRRLGADHDHSGTGEGGDELDVTSVSTDDATITTQLTYNNHDIGAILESETAEQRIISGTANFDDPGTASNDGWNSNTTDTKSQTFATAFSASPDVIITINGSGSGQVAQPNNLSTTGFDANMLWYRSDGSTGRSGFWFAKGDD